MYHVLLDVYHSGIMWPRRCLFSFISSFISASALLLFSCRQWV